MFLCAIKNILVDEILCDDTMSIEQRIKTIKPVHTTCGTYFGWNGDAICPWGKAQEKL